jgi:hypothetical protein
MLSMNASTYTNLRSEVPIPVKDAAPYDGQAQGTVPTRSRLFLWYHVDNSILAVAADLASASGNRGEK